MILKFIEATTQQPILVMADAIASIEPSNTDGVAIVYTKDTRALYIYGTVLAILAQMQAETSMATVAIAPIGS